MISPVFRVSQDFGEKMVEQYINRGGDSFYEYQLSAIAGGADPHGVFGGGHVHHINGCSYDHRPENLILLTPTEHGLVEQTELCVDKEKGIMYEPKDLFYYRSLK